MSEQNQYTEDNIRSLDWKEHIRMRPGMYIGKLGDGSSPDDGIYILLKETLDNCIDEYVMGAGKTIEVTIKDKLVTVRDYGRGIPLGKVVDVVSKMNTGGKYDSKAFKKSVGLNGVGTKAVNALSNYFRVESVRDNQQKAAEFSAGNLTLEEEVQETTKRKGTKVSFIADETIFKNYKYRNEYVIKMLKNYCYLNRGLTIYYNGEKYISEYGLKDLLEETISEEDLQPTKADLLLREQVAREDKYNLFEKAKPKAGVVLFPPAKGMITEKFNPKEKHYAVDVALAKNTPIKSVLSGTVIFADWTPTNGNVIIIRHNNGFISAYKHAASLTKDQGETVKSGEVVALAGSTGQESTGVHLHFELWKDGYPIDPSIFIAFE